MPHPTRPEAPWPFLLAYAALAALFALSGYRTLRNLEKKTALTLRDRSGDTSSIGHGASAKTQHAPSGVGCGGAASSPWSSGRRCAASRRQN